MKDVATCPCCRQNRPFPTQPGNWRYKDFSRNYKSDWVHVTILQSVTGILFPCNKDKNPTLWPSSFAKWEKLQTNKD